LPKNHIVLKLAFAHRTSVNSDDYRTLTLLGSFDNSKRTQDLYVKFVKEKAPSLDNLLNVISSIEEAKLKWRSVTSWVGVGLGWDGKARIGRIEP
jgi:hypothetical protein